MPLLLAHPELFAAGAVFQLGVLATSVLSDASSDTVRVSIIGSLALVFAAAVPALISSRRKAVPDVSLNELIEANRRLRQDYDALVKTHDKCSKREDRLEGMLWRIGINPITGEPLGGHDESPAL